jgi:tRNA(Leu) C34 or U34 (ribose-2'-O)-methylase TrmL
MSTPERIQQIQEEKKRNEQIAICFTRPKFLGLPAESQHKKCALLLRQIYEDRLQGQDTSLLVQTYNEIAGWMRIRKRVPGTLERIANLYHWHLQNAHICLREHNLLPAIQKNDREKAEEKWPIHLYLDNLRSAYNVGNLVRTFEGFGFGTIFFSEKTPSLNHNQVKKSSMGAHQWIDSKTVSSLEELPRPLVLLETCPDTPSVHEFLFPKSFTLALGNEEYGASETLREAADYTIHIPMRGRKNSLNVANAFSIAAGEILRQNLWMVKREETL